MNYFKKLSYLKTKGSQLNPIVEKKVVELAIECPEYGKLRLSKKLNLQGVQLSPAIIQTILIRNHLNTIKMRIKVLKEMSKNNVKLNKEQLLFLRTHKKETFFGSFIGWFFDLAWIL